MTSLQDTTETTTAAPEPLTPGELGAGASLAAVRDGVAVDTTMGFTALAGLVMATRCGDVDPGLRGLSGTSGDRRDVLAGRSGRDPDCALASDVFVHRLCREIAAMTAAVRGLDVLVPTGGIGEHVPPVRAEVASRLAYLGVAVDPDRNDAATGDADISRAGAAVRTVVVTAGEDLEIARQVTELLTPSQRFVGDR